MPPLPPSADPPWPADATRTPSMSGAGLLLGAGTVLAPMLKGRALALDPERVLALLSVAAGRPVPARALDGIRAAARHWAGGDRALANLRLLAGLHRLDEPLQVAKVQAAAWLLDNGLSPRGLMRELGLDTAALDAGAAQTPLGKYNPDQPRVPAGSGRESGRWSGAEGATAEGRSGGRLHVSHLRFDRGEVAANGPLTPSGVVTTYPGGVNPLDPKGLNKPPTPEEQQAIIDTLNRWLAGTKGEQRRVKIDVYRNIPHKNTGAVLPSGQTYQEYTVRTPGLLSRGERRLLIGSTGRMYYTNNHYRSFYRFHITGIN